MTKDNIFVYNVKVLGSTGIVIADSKAAVVEKIWKENMAKNLGIRTKDDIKVWTYKEYKASDDTFYFGDEDILEILM